MDESTKLGSPQRDYKTLSPSNLGEEATCKSQELPANNRSEMSGILDESELPKLEELDEDPIAVAVEESRKTIKKVRVPRRVIHFSDGVIEEFSTDSEEEEEKRKAERVEQEKKKKSLLDPKTLTWIPWAIYYTWFMGSTALTYCDYFGEKLAWFFGITSPKYYYELQEFERMKEEEEEEERKRKIEEHGWTSLSPDARANNAITEKLAVEQPKIQLQGLDPQNLQQSSHLSEQREILESPIPQELHTVDFDPESQMKHY